MVITAVWMLETNDGKMAHAEFYMPIGASVAVLKGVWEYWNGIQYLYNEDGSLFGMFFEPDAEQAGALEAWLSQNITPTTVEPGLGNFTQGPDQPTTVEFSDQGHFNIPARSWAQNYINNFPGKNNVH